MHIMMILQLPPWSGALDRLSALGSGAGQGAITLAVALGLLVLGWGLASVLSRLLRRALRGLRFDDAVQRVSGTRPEPRHEAAAVAAWVVYWSVMAVAALLALETLGFDLATPVADRLREVVPRIVTSGVLFGVGSLLAMLVGGVTHRFLQSAEVRTARLRGQIASAVLTGFAALVALEQLGLAAQFVMALGLVVVATAGLGVGLAFGLGCRELARDFIVEYLRSLDDERARRPE